MKVARLVELLGEIDPEWSVESNTLGNLMILAPVPNFAGELVQQNVGIVDMRGTERIEWWSAEDVAEPES